MLLVCASLNVLYALVAGLHLDVMVVQWSALLPHSEKVVGSLCVLQPPPTVHKQAYEVN